VAIATRSSTSEIVKGVHVIDTYANSILLTDQRLVLVDTSSEAAPTKIFDYLARVGVQPTDLTSIFVTHTHGDHVNGLAAIRAKATNAKVVASDVEAPFVAQTQPYPGPPRPAAHKGVPVDVRLKDGQKHEGFTMVFTPGHTKGSMSLWDPARRLLVAGDAVRTEGGLQPMEDVYNFNPKLHRESIKKLAQYDAETLVCGHGPPIASGAGRQLAELARRL
jgi:glyoxylase-like metal-dependent hydrolase (beta-lactamase superfamily II)